jgi:hypothetical protein
MEHLVHRYAMPIGGNKQGNKVTNKQTRSKNEGVELPRNDNPLSLEDQYALQSAAFAHYSMH